jgi:hypothetical protein
MQAIVGGKIITMDGASDALTQIAQTRVNTGFPHLHFS